MGFEDAGGKPQLIVVLAIPVSTPRAKQCKLQWQAGISTEYSMETNDKARGCIIAMAGVVTIALVLLAIFGSSTSPQE